MECNNSSILLTEIHLWKKEEHERLVSQPGRTEALTEDEAADTKKPMHGVQTPLDKLLEVWRDFSNEEIKRPVRGSR